MGEIAEGEYYVRWKNGGRKTITYYDAKRKTWWLGGQQNYTIVEFREDFLLGPPVVYPADEEFKEIDEIVKEK